RLEERRIERAVEVIEAPLLERPADMRLRVNAEIAHQRMELDALDGDGAGRERDALLEGLDLRLRDGDLAVGPEGDELLDGDRAGCARRDVELDLLREDLP